MKIDYFYVRLLSQLDFYLHSVQNAVKGHGKYSLERSLNVPPLSTLQMRLAVFSP